MEYAIQLTKTMDARLVANTHEYAEANRDKTIGINLKGV